MRSRSPIIAVALAFSALLPITGCALRHQIPQDLLQAHVSARFPVEENAGLWRVRLSDPVLALDPRTNRLGVELRIAVVGLGVNSSGRARLDGQVEYREQDGAFHLLQPSLQRLEWVGLPAELEAPIAGVVSLLSVNLIKDVPVYRLDPTRNADEAKIRGHLKRFWVGEGGIVVEYHL